MLMLSLGLFVLSTISAALRAQEFTQLNLLGYSFALEGVYRIIVYSLGTICEIFLLTSLYLVMPFGRLAFTHALIGGITATVLWELTRQFLVWYFSNLSLVNIIYGSLTSAIIILLSVEAVAIIILLGAQVIAEYERIDADKDMHEPLHTD